MRRRAGRVQARLRRRLGQVPHRLLEDVRATVRRLRRPALAWNVTALQGARRLATGRSSRGSACCRTTASTPNATQAVWELRLSHWTGDLPVLTIDTDWAWHQWDHLFGTFTYDGQPVFGFKSTPGRQPARHVRPQPLRRHVRLGLRHGLEAREQLPDAHRTPASSVTASTRTARHPAGKGTKYRATVEGPGVTPDVMWQGDAPGRVRQGRRRRRRTTRSRSSATSSASAN